MLGASSPAGVLSLALWTSSCATATLLYVSSYSGTVTTLNLTGSVLESVASTDGCAGSPSWLTLDYLTAVLYCTDEGLTTGEGSLSSFSTNEDGSLVQLDQVSTIVGPVAAAIYGRCGRGLALPHYGGSSLTTWDISNPSALTEVQTETFTLSEPGPVPDRQDAPHPHFTVVDPTGHFVLVPDLGADLVRVYAVPSSGLELTAVEPLAVAPGSGPRHAAFAVHGETTFMYVITELANTIIGYTVSYPEGSIAFEENFTIGTHGEGNELPEGAQAAEIVVTTDANFLIISSRNESIFEIPDLDPAGSVASDTLVNFSIDGDTGALTQLQEVPSGGIGPRQFSINKAGTLVAVGAQSDGRVVLIERDPETGMLGEFVAHANVEGEITAVIFNE